MKRYPNFCGPIEYINHIPYQIVARYPITEVRDAQGIKKWLGCDTVFKANRLNLFIFCNQIEEAEIVKLI
jgi:hypothetical protein